MFQMQIVIPLEVSREFSVVAKSITSISTFVHWNISDDMDRNLWYFNDNNNTFTSTIIYFNTNRPV